MYKCFLDGKNKNIIKVPAISSTSLKYIVCGHLSSKFEISIVNLSQEHSCLLLDQAMSKVMHKCPKHDFASIDNSLTSLFYLLPLSTCSLEKNEKKSIYITEELFEANDFTPYINIFKEHGLIISTIKSSFVVEGALKSGTYDLPVVNVEFINGLLFYLPTLPGSSKINVNLKKFNAAELDSIQETLNILKSYNIKINKTPSGFSMSGNQKYKTKKKLIIDGDYLYAAFFLVANFFGASYKLLCLNEKSKQPHIIINDIIKQVKKQTKGLTVDCKNISELVPLLCILLSYNQYPATITNINNNLYPMVDNVPSYVLELKRLGFKLEFNNNKIIVNQIDKINTVPKNIVEGWDNAYIIMALTVLSIKYPDKLMIMNVPILDLLYPNFFTDWGL